LREELFTAADRAKGGSIAFVLPNGACVGMRRAADGLHELRVSRTAITRPDREVWLAEVLTFQRFLSCDDWGEPLPGFANGWFEHESNGETYRAAAVLVEPRGAA
jgi:hypothetical protein